MNNGQNARRVRAKSNNKRPSNKRSNTAARIDSRVKGNPKQLMEKYRSLGEDALQAGDRIEAENYFQYSDHYQRVLNERNGLSTGLFDDRDAEQPGRGGGRPRGAERPAAERQGERQGERQADGDAERDAGAADQPKPRRRRRPQPAETGAEAGQPEERRAEREMANGPRADTAPAADAAEDAAPRKRRPGRPRKAVSADGGAQDAPSGDAKASQSAGADQSASAEQPHLNLGGGEAVA
ncbi:hypothetical protein CCR85_07940 [Rhodothalassium salexigens]|uniref:DUF4167 domain-containing protein n=1 Tax=Rhodothalassium salexigens TaxID=1086 RepID=UPI001911C48B|nr:DUF4167 domain-containing protein [Rhodothalassium salexigens]MBK5911423.1 hypothetical protein [Rhodothalassium salexigens]MBK5920686.1 hypothetical protein [Rhodothalassium salexigens]